MSSVAIFVDAGYLFAQGSAAVSGSGKSRQLLRLDERIAVSELINVASAKCGSLPLLRVYWYDGARSARNLPPDHATLAHMDHVKLRLGFITTGGQQKGVDSLIVTDMIELARNHAISDAVLLSGDEDVRIGVQIAQSFGARVHLLGIAPCRGSQSLALMQEAHTTTEWDNAVVAKFLSVMQPLAVTTPTPATAIVSKTVMGPPIAGSADDAKGRLNDVVSRFHTALSVDEVTIIKDAWGQRRGLPPYVDGRLLAQCRTLIGRDLTPEERRYVRAMLAGHN